MCDLTELRNQLLEKDKEIDRLRALVPECKHSEGSYTNSHVDIDADRPCHNSMNKHDIDRYSRQMLLPELGVRGQLALHNKSVIIVGCGGLGSPAAMYLAGCGIGHLGLLDHDVVELSNLHRQIMHSETGAKQEMLKAVSAAASCSRINSHVVYETHNVVLSAENALDILRKYDIVVDATDNVATRYLLNDACVLLDRPLVSGGVLRFEGQLTVYNYQGSPCYRCIYPVPPPPDTVSKCSEAGVLGPVVGVFGSMLAVEVVKIAAGIGTSCAGRIIFYDGLDATVRCIRLRGKRKTCEVCGDNPSVTALIDYDQFCGASAVDKCQKVNMLTESERISAQEYAQIVHSSVSHFLVDVRKPVELEIVKLPSTTHNVPMDEFDKAEGRALLLDVLGDDVRKAWNSSAAVPVFVVCRRGNDSQIAVRKLQSYFADLTLQIKDIIGGLHAWSRDVDTEFPVY